MSILCICRGLCTRVPLIESSNDMDPIILGDIPTHPPTNRLSPIGESNNDDGLSPILDKNIFHRLLRLANRSPNGTSRRDSLEYSSETSDEVTIDFNDLPEWLMDEVEESVSPKDSLEPPAIVSLFPESHNAIREPLEYSYLRSEYVSFGEELSSILRAQIDKDRQNAHLSPVLFHEYEDILTNNGIERLFLEPRPVAVTALSTIFRVRNRPDLVLKYQVDCGEEELSAHPLLRDSIGLDLLKDTGLVPQVVFISPPAVFRHPISPKTSFLLPDTNVHTCMATGEGVRVIAMERLGISIYRHVTRYGPSFKLAVQVMSWLVRSLETIHSRGIVHGDIHSGNIVWENEDRTGFRLIDFGLATFRGEREGLPTRVRPRLDFVHNLHSPWELEGWRSTFKDDLYKAFMVGAFVMHGLDYNEYVTSLESNGEAMLRFKKSFIFEYPNSRSVIELSGLGIISGSLLRIRLQRMLASVERPDYQWLAAELDKILELVK